MVMKPTTRRRKDKTSKELLPAATTLDKVAEKKPYTGKPRGFQKGHPVYKRKIPVDKPPPITTDMTAADITTNRAKADKFRNDLFWIYQQVGGRTMLRDLIKDPETSALDRSMLKDVLKLLLQVYSKEMDAALKREMAGAGQNTGTNFIFMMDGLGKAIRVIGDETAADKLLSMFGTTDPDIPTEGVTIEDPEGDA